MSSKSKVKGSESDSKHTQRQEKKSSRDDLEETLRRFTQILPPSFSTPKTPVKTKDPDTTASTTTRADKLPLFQPNAPLKGQGNWHAWVRQLGHHARQHGLGDYLFSSRRSSVPENVDSAVWKWFTTKEAVNEHIASEVLARGSSLSTARDVLDYLTERFGRVSTKYLMATFRALFRDRCREDEAYSSFLTRLDSSLNVLRDGNADLPVPVLLSLMLDAVPSRLKSKADQLELNADLCTIDQVRSLLLLEDALVYRSTPQPLASALTSAPVPSLSAVAPSATPLPFRHQRQMCFDFLKAKRCSKGASCKYIHDKMISSLVRAAAAAPASPAGTRRVMADSGATDHVRAAPPTGASRLVNVDGAFSTTRMELSASAMEVLGHRVPGAVYNAAPAGVLRSYDILSLPRVVDDGKFVVLTNRSLDVYPASAVFVVSTGPLYSMPRDELGL